MPTYERFVTTEQAAILCGCSEAAIRGACHRGALTRYGTFHQPAWDLQQLAAWSQARMKRRQDRVA